MICCVTGSNNIGRISHNANKILELIRININNKDTPSYIKNTLQTCWYHTLNTILIKQKMAQSRVSRWVIGYYDGVTPFLAYKDGRATYSQTLHGIFNKQMSIDVLQSAILH